MDLSVVSLLISNITVITLAVVQKWDVSEVLWVYWMQSVIIGLFQFLRILSLKNFSTDNSNTNGLPALPANYTKLFLAFFFAGHYGTFHLVYAIFLFMNFTKHPLDLTYLLTGGLIFFLNHLYSFYHHRIADQQKTQNIFKLTFAPYVRIIPMHLIIVFGAILNQSVLVVFLFIKTLVDLVTHTNKHRL